MPPSALPAVRAPVHLQPPTSNLQLHDACSSAPLRFRLQESKMTALPAMCYCSLPLTAPSMSVCQPTWKQLAYLQRSTSGTSL